MTIQALRSTRATLKWYLRTLGREAVTALLLGAACGLTVGLIVWFWHWAGLAAITIGASVFVVLFGACLLGLSVPSLLHALKMDLKIAAGPVTLAAIDIFTILSYFSLAAILL
jgi:magnesium transporter